MGTCSGRGFEILMMSLLFPEVTICNNLTGRAVEDQEYLSLMAKLDIEFKIVISISLFSSPSIVWTG